MESRIARRGLLFRSLDYCRRTWATLLIIACVITGMVLIFSHSIAVGIGLSCLGLALVIDEFFGDDDDSF